MYRRTFLAGLFAPRSRAGLISAGGAAERHRIVSAEWFVYGTGRMRPDYWRPDIEKPVYGIALRLKTDAGAEGAWAEEVRIHGVKRGPVLTYASVRHGTEAMVELDIGTTGRRVASLLVGRSPAGVEANWNHLHSNSVPLELITMVDLALWDLCGRIADKPVYQLIGQKREYVKAYVSSMPNLAGPEAWAKHAVACKQRGYQGYKIHPYILYDPVRKKPIEEYRGFPEHDLAIVRAVREAVGPDFPVALDNAWTYTFEQAVQTGKVLDELRIKWYESPMPEEDGHLDAYIALAKAIRTPVCAPQAGDGGHAQRVRWIESGACGVCRADLYAPGGGLTSTLIVAEACARAKIGMDLHAWGASIYNLQAIAAIPESVEEFQETYDADPATSLKNAGRRMDRTSAALSFATYEPDAKGRVRFPEGAGMGIGVKWDFIQNHLYTGA